MNPFEEKPRWPGAPPICEEANLPAFETLADMKAFQTKLAGDDSMDRKKPVLCRYCGFWHYESRIK